MEATYKNAIEVINRREADLLNESAKAIVNGDKDKFNECQIRLAELHDIRLTLSRAAFTK